VANKAHDISSGAVSLTVPSHPKYLYVIRSVIFPLAVEAGFGRKEARHIVLAVDEACSNVIKHAYGGDPSKTIVLTVSDDASQFTVQLRDRGKRVDRASIAPRELDEVRPGGLGTHFMGTVFDAVHYDTTVDEGTLLTLGKKKQQVGT